MIWQSIQHTKKHVRSGNQGKRWENSLLNLRKDNKIALVVDNQSLQALEWFPIDRDLSYNDVVRWMYDSLYELNMECDVVDIKRSGSF